MTQIQKWQAVNQCGTSIELGALILQFADKKGKIKGRTRKFDALEMALGLSMFMENKMYPEILTREFGIRQQAIYLKQYKL
jgi:hypothetical protein